MLSLRELHTKSKQSNSKRETKKDFVPLHPACPLYQEYLERMRTKRDLRIIISARNCATGVGKSTLGLWLALSFKPDWNPSMACFTIEKYVDLYKHLPPGSVILYDESYFDLDARRSMKQEHIDISNVWRMMRVRQIVTLFIAPSLLELDKRVRQYADYHVHVLHRGRAIVSQIQISRYDATLWEEDICSLRFPNLDDHPFKAELDRMKDELIDHFLNKMLRKGDKKKFNEIWYKIGEEVEKRKELMIRVGATDPLRAAILEIADRYGFSDEEVEQFYQTYVEAKKGESLYL